MKASLVQWKIYASGSPSSGLKRTILFLEISQGFLCIFRRKDQRSCVGRGGGHYIFCVVILYIIFYWKALHAGVPFSNPGHKIVIIDFLVMNKKKRSCDRRGRGARSAPFGHVKKPRKTGARSARARTRGKNPLLLQTLLSCVQPPRIPLTHSEACLSVE